jgi:hypothetical protein
MHRNFILKMVGCYILVLFLGTSMCTALSTATNNMTGGALTFFSTMDTMIVQNGPDNNFGTNPTMEIRNFGSGWEEDALVRFNLSSIQPGETIGHATLFLFYSHYQDNNPAWRKIKLYQIASEWNESTVTWNTRPSIEPQGTSSAHVPLRTGIWMRWDVTKEVQDFTNGIKKNYGWRLIDDQFWNGWDIPRTHYSTKENGYNVPYLEVTTQNQNLTVSFVSGKIKNLKTEGDVVTFDAVQLRMITFAPFTTNTYSNGEMITVEGAKVGIITTNFVFGFFKVII